MPAVEERRQFGGEELEEVAHLGQSAPGRGVGAPAAANNTTPPPSPYAAVRTTPSTQKLYLRAVNDSLLRSTQP
ncbi:hypothetical protein, partial [Nocardia cyriacigeorgica]|uniref:hypothetical protein n=1 Tax=Nocardia cyriacigeorgica TaxID=135487 RepID=UPI0024587B1E